jgi:2,4-dienoyl-CoA reductase-like NADH-dependent reductase (Old Yellow Enzyme family)
MLLDVVKAARAKTGREFAIAVKLNSADFQKGGFSFADSTQVVKWLAAEGVDLIEISGGNYEQPRMMDIAGMEQPDLTGLTKSTAAREAYFADFAAQMRKDVTVPLMVTGGFRSASAMSQAISDDGIAMIGLGRPLCVDTECVNRLLNGSQAVLEKWESQLRVGPGLLGPQSPFGLMKVLNGFGATYWYYQQFRRFGRGEGADEGMSVFMSLVRELQEQKRWLAARKAD